jgi:phospholipid-binding lipoprotein MlaA
MRVLFRPISLAAAALLLATLAGCAKPPPPGDADALADYNEANDPLEPTNRVMYDINHGIDVVVLRPLALGYRYIVPVPVRTHVHNVLDNLGTPVVLVNDMMQGKPRRAGDTFMRMLLNTTIGVAGIFDVATPLGWPLHDSDPGITLAVWGLPTGPYLYLPILGPTNPRDAAGFGIGIVEDPFTWLGNGYIIADLGYIRYGVTAVDARERVLDTLDKALDQALDPYATLRSLSRQHRESQIDDVRNDKRATVPAWYPQPPATPAQ